jgi:hypothetical protein
MSKPKTNARMLAMKALIDFFPNAKLIARDVEREHGRPMVAGVVKELRRLRTELRKLLKEIKSTNNTNHT